MKLKLRALATSVVALLWACIPGGALAADPPAPVLTPLVADVLWAPKPVRGSDERFHLVYELRLANFTSRSVNLESVKVLDATGKSVEELDKDQIGKRFSIGGRRGAEASSLTVGQFGVLFLHVSNWLKNANPPNVLSHRISGTLVKPGEPNEPFDITVGKTSVADFTNLTLGPPLLGTGYLAGDGCCNSIRHVRALLPLNGRFTLAQRFAIDWEQVGADQRLVHDKDLKKVASYNIYGRDVIAVADGTVVATRSDLPEQIPGKLPVGLPVEQADGNFVVLDIGNGAFALFAHMQPGSVKVAVGAKVKRGAVLGKVGNTGNTSAPHLHFHVMDGPSPLLSNGLPYVIDQFTMTAVDNAGTEDFNGAEETGSPLTLMTLVHRPRYQKVLPMDLTVVEFSR
jgi:peptidase M23-like protein